MKKRSLSLFLVFMLVFTLLAGCSNQPAASGTSGSTPAASASSGDPNAINFDEEPYEINFLYLVASEGPNQQKVNDAVNELALRELNMKVNLIPMTYGTYLSQIQLTLAANEPLDLFPTRAANFSNYIESQYVLNCADYLDYAPDIVSTLGDDAFTAYVGDFLIGFSQMKERAYPNGLVVRKDIFDELGYKVEDFNVNTDNYASFDQITELYAAVQAKYPTMVCLDGPYIMARQIDSYVDTMGSEFGALANYGQTTEVTNWFESEQYKQFCLIAREWYQKGYSSSDIAINKDSGEVKMRAGNCFSYFANTKPNTNVEKLAQTGYEVEIIPVGSAMKNTNAVNSIVYSIANSSKNPVKAMQFLNWTYTSGEFNDLINWGIEGEDWVVDENGMAAYPDGVDATNVGYHNDYGWSYPNQFAGHAWAGNPTDIWDQYREYNAGLLVSKAYGFTFNSVGVANEEAQLAAVLEQYRNDLAFGVIDVEAGLADFNKALYDAGLQKVIDEKQRQLDEWLAG